MKILFLFLNLFLIVCPVFAQENFALKGLVIEKKTKDLIENVNISILNSNYTTSTNEKGEFEIQKIQKKQIKIVVSRLGYKTFEKNIVLTSDSNFVLIELQNQTTELEQVTVIGETEEQADFKKVKQNVMPVTIITAKQIENRAGNLNEILARQAGIQIRYSGGLGSDSRISVRGLEGKRVQIFLDGNPLNSPDGSLGINDLPVQIIERIEIYKGAVPAWLGGDGLGT